MVTVAQGYKNTEFNSKAPFKELLFLEALVCFQI